MTAPSILRPVPDLTTRTVTDLDAWHAEIDRRRAVNAAERAQREAAAVSQGKPVHKARKPRSRGGAG